MHTVPDPVAALSQLVSIEAMQEEVRTKTARLRRMFEAQANCEAQGIDYAEVESFGVSLNTLDKRVLAFDRQRRKDADSGVDVMPPVPAWRHTMPLNMHSSVLRGGRPSRTTLLHKGIDAGVATFVVLADGSTVTLDTPILRPLGKAA